MEKETKKKGYFKFGKDIFWVSLSQILISLFGIFSLPALTQNYGAEIYGLWSQIYITVGLLNPILNLNFTTAIVRYVGTTKNQKKRSQEISTMLLVISIFIFLLIILFTIKRYEIAKLLFESTEYAIFVPLTIIWASVAAYFYFLISILRSRGKIKLLSLLSLTCSISQLSLIVILASFQSMIITIVISQIIIEIIFVLIIYLMIIKDIGISKPNFKNIRKYLSFSLPQIPNGLLLWILNFCDRYFIMYYLGLVEVGIYSVSYTIGNLITFFYSPISFVVYPILAKHWENSEFNEVTTYLEYSTKFFLTLAIPASLGIYVLSTPLLKILTTSEFVLSNNLSFLIALGTIFLGLFQINLYIVYLLQKTKWIPFMTLVSSIVNILLNVILIPTIGIIGSAVATLISYIILSVIIALWTRKEVNYSIDLKFVMKLIISSIIMVIIINLLIDLIGTNGITQLFLYMGLGTIIYFMILFALRTFSEKEKKMIMELYDNVKEIFKSTI